MGGADNAGIIMMLIMRVSRMGSLLEGHIVLLTMTVNRRGS